MQNAWLVFGVCSDQMQEAAFRRGINPKLASPDSLQQVVEGAEV